MAINEAVQKEEHPALLGLTTLEGKPLFLNPDRVQLVLGRRQDGEDYSRIIIDDDGKSKEFSCRGHFSAVAGPFVTIANFKVNPAYLKYIEANDGSSEEYPANESPYVLRLKDYNLFLSSTKPSDISAAFGLG